MKQSFKNITELLFNKYLPITNTCTSAVLMASGDAIQQSCNSSENKYDWLRTYNMLKIGFLLGPLQHYFYQYVDKRFPSEIKSNVIKKVITEQIIASPAYIIAFFVTSAVVEKELNKCFAELKEKFFKIYMIDCLVWPPTQFINYSLLKPKYRMLYVNITTMFYNIMLSYFKYQ